MVRIIHGRLYLTVLMYNFAARFLYVVKKKEEYIVPVKGLGLGSYQYTYKIDEKFFNSFECFDIDKGLLNLTVDLVKEPNLLNFRFHFTGFVELQCDRCLDRFDLDVENSFRLIVNYGEKFEEVSDEIITVPSNENNMDLGQYIFEYVNLMLPIKKVHPDDEDGNSTCNKEMLNRLDEHSKQKSDSRWDALKNMELE